MTKVSGSLDTDFQYAGMYYHATSGLNLAKYRAYNPDTGRWISRDPIAEQGGINLYAYCDNDPINGVDPDGRFPLVIVIYIAIIAVAASILEPSLEVTWSSPKPKPVPLPPPPVPPVGPPAPLRPIGPSVCPITIVPPPTPDSRPQMYPAPTSFPESPEASRPKLQDDFLTPEEAMPKAIEDDFVR